MMDVRRVVLDRPKGLSLLTAGTGEPVVFLHGIPTGAELWRDVLSRFAEAGYDATAPDLPGYGKTRVPLTCDHSLAGAASTVAAWMESSLRAPAWVVGHDAGGAVAQILAVHFASLVRRLTLVNSIADGFWPEPRARITIIGAKLRTYRPLAAIGVVPNPLLRRVIRRGFASGPPSRAVETTVFWDDKVSDRAGRQAFQRHLAALTPAHTAEIVDRLPAIAVPSQLVWGMRDTFQPWDGPGRRLADLLPSAAVTQLPGCGHFVPLECPGALVSTLLEWRATAP